ncbi:sporulation histidine kinase inhibitor Sda [Litchfieldia salsa]|uniref:Sporulation inhibitor A n=1 Tax=Litchfieldia salsa TaxID=930152 RepID=A0A1H0TYU7_9BACI|nr:sporulation histidine kinase inhibitor Sda [Litchfieldia salsa]SDP59119.1 Sporulation inhibitor A [Litchfieldia salsa]
MLNGLYKMKISDTLLIRAYKEAVSLGLSQEFIQMLKEEINHRNLNQKMSS